MVQSGRKASDASESNGSHNVDRPATTGGAGKSNFSNPLRLRRPHNIFAEEEAECTQDVKVPYAFVPKQSATWVVKSNDPLIYNTENVDSFNDPKKKTVNAIYTKSHSGLESSRDKQRMQAADKFFKLAKSRYGGAEDFFRALRMGKSDSIMLDEFSEMLRKRSLDLFFPRDQQRLLFEHFDKSHSSKIGVGDVINQYEQAAPTVVVTERISQQQRKERNEMILSKIYKDREDKKLLVTPRQTTIQIVRSLRCLDTKSTGFITKEELRWGLGKNYLNIALTDEEIDNIVESCPCDERTGKISYDKFARYLDIRNDDPVIEPFFDARANQITRMKNRINALDRSINDENTVARRDYLMKVCHGDAHSTKVKSGGISCFDNANQSSSLNKTMSCPEITLSQSPIRSRRYDYHQAEHDVTQPEAPNSHFLSSSKTRGKGGDQHLNSLDLSDDVSSVSSGLMPGGKRLFHKSKFDETLLQHDMGNSTLNGEYPPDPDKDSISLSYSKYLSDDDSRFNTTSSSYFAPLLYRPSVPVTRPNVLGDSMKCALKREERRRRRYERTAKNLQSFAELKELEEISTKMNDDMRCKGRALEALHYESAAMHIDLKKFSKQKLVSMQRKPNKALFEKMWGGDRDHSRRPVDRLDDRDFNTTYKGSYVLHSAD